MSRALSALLLAVLLIAPALVHGGNITQSVYRGSGATTCRGRPERSLSFAEGSCRAGSVARCSYGHTCMRMRVYRSLSCDGAFVAQTGQVCGVCSGGGGAYIKYTCGGGLAISSCTDSACQQCSAPVSLPTGCRYGQQYETVPCNALTMSFHGSNTSCAGRVTQRTTVPAGLCDADIMWSCP